MKTLARPRARTFNSLLRHLVLLAFLLLGGYPLLWMALSALRHEGDLLRHPFSLPETVTLENFAGVWATGGFGRAYLNSFVVCGVGVVVATLAAALAAFAFGRFRFRGKEWLFLLLLAGMMIPVHITLIPLNRLLGPAALGLKDSYWALIGPYVGFAIPVSILILRGAFAALPQELFDAAQMDGCSWWRAFWCIGLPLVRPALATVVIFNFLTMWNEFVFALTLISDRNMRTLPLALWEFKGEHGMVVTQTCAALCVAILPVLFVYAAAQRHIIHGLTAGAVRE